jgi:hypothetical protein
LDKVAGHSTDEHWNPKWIEGESIVRKLLSLKNLAMYWNNNEEFLKFSTTDEAGKKLYSMVSYFNLILFIDRFSDQE